MKTKLRRIGNSLGVIVPRTVLDRWELTEGDWLEIAADGIRPAKRRSAHGRLDDFKRNLAIEVARANAPEDIRRHALENLARWKRSGAWCSAYDDWRRIVESGDDGMLFAAMLGRDDEANRLRQSPPYVGMLPRDVLDRLREEAAG